ncbi:putative mannosyl-oligosaccharide glucosidase [Phaeomoniella chlamydospora]|uniref:Mannosyl-oligosaccharide glucosidase n=1 Tax=Phaeomoniella chlamydospora TaxID=158046 RepID=A0A0G2G5S8_PHACM|nr:putative mannosyl-oligosaccharide glucosidase [Phaeomoniella chlamydospora]
MASPGTGHRSNLYFGVRPRLPRSLMTGLMWAKVDNYASVQNDFRHTCEQHAGMAGYGWEKYDIRTGGREVIHDAGNGIDITIDFVKVPGGSNGGNWGARIKGTPREDAPPVLLTSMIFYTGMEGFGTLDVTNEPDELGQEGQVTISGQTVELGDFKLDITKGPDTNTPPMNVHEAAWAEKPLDRTIVSSMQVPIEAIWQAKQVVFSQMKTTVDGYWEEYGQDNMPPPWQTFTIQNNIEPGNLHFVQKTFQGAFEFDILFSSASSPEPMTSENLQSAISKSIDSFSGKFTNILNPKSPFNADKYSDFSQAMFSNLVGGTGYFYGDSLVDRSYAPEYEEENEGFWEETAEARQRAQVTKDPEVELFTMVPSRPFFPRGFLWDEGFHLIPVIDWDPILALQIVQSWFALMDSEGWIAREQILGPEARSKVPPEFQVQYPHYANPPTLFMVVDVLVQKLYSNALEPDTAKALKLGVEQLYPLLKRQYEWFRRTQTGDIKSYDREAFSTREAYRWRGRTVRHILTSGLDDYPRPQPPHPGELHVDLISWVGLMTRSLNKVAKYLGEDEDATTFSTHVNAIVRNIDDLHWSNEASAYCDATIDDYEEHVLICHKGYISLFPFMAGLLSPDSSHLDSVLDLISDPEELWSDHGIRSLSKKDPKYGLDENYWRSPVWMNMNYLIVDNLHRIATATNSPHKSKAAKIYNALRRNLVNTVYNSWLDTGFAWEQYNPDTGAGQRTQHFTGWTSLVVSIAAMDELPVAGGKPSRDEL